MVTITPSTATTTPSEPSSAGSRTGRRARWFVAVLSFALGAALVALAVPRTIAAWEALPAQPVILKLAEGGHPDKEVVEAGIAALKDAIAWTPSGKRYTDLAVLELELALRMAPNDLQRRDLLASAERYVSQGLALNPVDAYAWLRLAYIRHFRQAPHRDVAAALVQSLDMGPNVRGLWLPRAEMMLAYMSAMTADELFGLRRHLYVIWSADPGSRLPLLRLASHQGKLAFVGWAASLDPEASAEYERLVATLPKP